jgi:hypothetical protein
MSKNPIFYKYLYDDIKDMSYKEAFDHYNNHGKKEGRLFSKNDFYKMFPNFSYEFYKNMNKDLKDLDELSLIKHYYYNGQNEGRIFSKNEFYNMFPNFSHEFYKNMNNDLKNFDELSLIKHYIQYNKIEKRISSLYDFYNVYPDFNINFYRLFNDDINELDDLSLLKHYNENGRFEDRIISEKVFLANYPYCNIEILKKLKPDLSSIDLFKYYYDYKRFENKNEKIYNKDMDIQYIIDYLIENNIKILICNYNYDQSSGGITILHYLCHLINYISKTNIAYLINIKSKNILDYDDEDFYLKTNRSFITPLATKDILLTRNNIVLYMENIKGNPLEQKYVVRWMLYFESGSNMKTWDNNDLILWYCDLYRKYNKNIQEFNNDIIIDDISNNQIIFSILANINKLLDINSNFKNKLDECCYTIRKIGKTNINGNKALSKPNYKYNNECTNCKLKKWPTECTCKDYSDGIKIIHDTKNYNKVYRFEYPTKLVDEIELFKNTGTFYCYDPFCFSAVIASLHNCLTVIPKLELFGNENIYENVPWVQYGISYGNDEESINNALNTLPFTKILLRNLFYNINYDYMKVFFESIYNHFFKKNFITNIIENIKPKKVVMLIYMNNYGYELKSLLETNIIFKNYFEIIILNSFEDNKDIDILVYDKENNVFVPEYVQKILLNTENEKPNVINLCNEIVNSLHININFDKTII